MLPSTERKQHELEHSLPDSEGELRVVFELHYERMLRAMHLLVAAALDVRDFVLDDPSARRFLLEAGARAVTVDTTTQQAIADALVKGQQAGESTFELARRIDHLFNVTWKSRADTVARTELQHAQLRAAVDRYQASGMVQRVMLHDGGTNDSDGFCNARNGRIVPLHQTPSLAHPNCTLAISPIVEEPL